MKHAMTATNHKANSIHKNETRHMRGSWNYHREYITVRKILCKER
jgi:hypothetical protein